MESSETAGEHSLTKLEIQLGLISEAFGESFGIQLFDDGTLDYLYVRGVILVRDAYLAEVARLLEEDDEPEERGRSSSPSRACCPGSACSRWATVTSPGSWKRSTQGSAWASLRRITSCRSRRSGPARPANRRACRSARRRTRANAPAAGLARSSI